MGGTLCFETDDDWVPATIPANEARVPRWSSNDCIAECQKIVSANFPMRRVREQNYVARQLAPD